MNDESRYLIPRNGVRVPDPITKASLLKEGEHKPWKGPDGRYWRRRHKDGDVFIVRPPKPQTKIVEIEETKNIKKIRKVKE